MIEELAKLLSSNEIIIKSFDEEDLSYKPEPNKLSKKEIL